MRPCSSEPSFIAPLRSWCMSPGSAGRPTLVEAAQLRSEDRSLLADIAPACGAGARTAPSAATGASQTLHFPVSAGGLRFREVKRIRRTLIIIYRILGPSGSHFACLVTVAPLVHASSSPTHPRYGLPPAQKGYARTPPGPRPPTARAPPHNAARLGFMAAPRWQKEKPHWRGGRAVSHRHSHGGGRGGGHPAAVTRRRSRRRRPLLAEEDLEEEALRGFIGWRSACRRPLMSSSTGFCHCEVAVSSLCQKLGRPGTPGSATHQPMGVGSERARSASQR